MDDADHDLSYGEVRETDLTPELCIQRCRRLAYSYAGVQDSTHCRCGNTMGKHGTGTAITCSGPCSGNSSETCGAKWRTDTFLVGKYTFILQ